ncbi:hypothetical protein GWK47_024684 [Chionoecetes opilio]|uniref:Uncharacterized protein n=1 Tax=Chionoecetes opilio TaxID=41210 RepID=A0A8J5CDK5_CHIOP|nr:hypothetical protein GWK47_024684 [Chionoecetes opilio]
MEYSPLAWSSCPPSYLGLLDRVQARAQRLARLKAPEAAAQIIQPLQQRRDVAGMCVMYKAHRMQLLQLAELRLNPRARPFHSTRVAHNINHQVTVPFAKTEHYLRSFLSRYGRLWNTLVRQTDLHLTTSLHAFKSGLRLNPRARPSHSTRAAHNIDHQVTVPFARTEHYLRSFLSRYGRLWNTLVRQTDLHFTTSLHAFKSGVNAWLDRTVRRSRLSIFGTSDPREM